ncbi:MAG: hypothetical protein IKF90_20600 [Parasporobacterium sp.]|nr:hypothetical protein [Parasporobacterium sp.]
MAFSWKFFNETDQQSVDELVQIVQEIKNNHKKLQNLKSVDLNDDEDKALEELMKKHKKKLEGAVDVLSEFDTELDNFVKAVEKRLKN